MDITESNGLTRRSFLKATGTATVLGSMGNLCSPVKCWASAGTFATMVDITKCDGCENESTPKCIEACRNVNAKRFPIPKQPIKPLWPQKSYDDWSEKNNLINALTPYNWIMVQRIEMNGENIFVPRRCMHCYNPPCANLCPFGALDKFRDGAVVINPNLCLGGAKCKAVCPWKIPQRQSGVGIYLKLQPIPAGGGVMYKCDLCHDLITQGNLPACVEACEKKLGANRPLFFGYRGDIITMAHERAATIGGFIYGEKENGGTATLYVSKIPFEQISAKLLETKSTLHMNKVSNRIDDVNRWAAGFFAGPVVLAAGAIALALYRRKKDKKEGE